MSTPAASPELPAPAPPVNPETQEFWAATARGQLLLKRCLDCDSVIWYPRAFCPECAGLRTEWFEASGRGRIYSYTVNHRGEGAYQGQPPFVLAYVELDEGPRMMTNIVDCPQTPEALELDMKLEVKFETLDDAIALPLFRPTKG
jgi:uncharacterized protein